MTGSGLDASNKKAAGSKFWEFFDYNDRPNINGDEINRFNIQLQNTISEENVQQAKPFLNGEGHLCVAVPVYSMAGADFYWQEIDLDNFTLMSDYDQGLESAAKGGITEDEAYELVRDYWNFVPGTIVEETGQALFLTGKERIPVNNQSSGGLGILGLIGAAVLFLILRRFSPSLSRLFLIIGIIAISCVIALVALLMYFAFRKPKKKLGSVNDRTVLLQKGRSDLLELRQFTLRIHDRRIRKSGEEVCRVVEKILAALKEQPEDIPKVRQLFSYYLPTFGGILQRYVRLEQSGVPAADDAEKVAVCLDGIQVAMRKMYDSLYDDDKLDLTVEIETLKQICKRDGLLLDSSAQTEREDLNITLTL